MAAQVLFTAAVVGTVALNAADIILNRLHKKKAKKALIEREKEKGRVADENSSEEEETSSEEEETTHVITSQDRDRYGNRLRQSSPANNRSDTSVQGPQYSRNRSPLPGSTNMLSPNSGRWLTPASSTKPVTQLEVYKPRNNSFPSSSTARDPAVARQIAHASSIVDEHKRERQTRRRFSSVSANAGVVPRTAAPVTQNLLTEHEEPYQEELDPLLFQLREQRQQRDRDILFKPKPKPQPWLQPEQYNILSEGNTSPASQPMNYNQDELTRTQLYGDATSTPPMKQRRASQPPQWHIPEMEERRKAAEYLASRSTRYSVANSVHPPSLVRSGSVSSQQNPGSTKNFFTTNSTPTSTDDPGGVPLLSLAGRSSSRSTEYESLPRDYSATVSETSELYIDNPMRDREMPEPSGSIVDRWLGNTDTVVSEKKGCPSSEPYMFEESKPKPPVYISEVNDLFQEDTRVGTL